MRNLNSDIFFESFQEDESLVEEVGVEEQTLNARKERKMITKPIIESFLSLLDMRKSVKEMTTVLNLSKSTIKRLYKRYLNQEFVNLTNFKTASEKKRESTKDFSLEANIVATELALDPCIGLNNLTDRLRDLNPAGNFSKSTVCRIVKKCGYTNKTLTLVPINRNSAQNKLLRAQFARNIDNLSDDRLVFLDETGFNLHLTNNRGYSMKNSKCYINVPNSKGTKVSLMCTITLNGLYAYKTKIGSFKAADFVEFINNELPLASPEERKIVIMDNASIHRTALVSFALRERGYGLMFLPPYTPQLNPIEEFFSCLKNHTRQRPRSENTQSLINCINDVLRNDVFNMDGYFNHMRQIIPMALSNADII